MTAVTAVSSTSEAETQLVRYQQKLAADLAAKAAEKVIFADKDAVARARQAVRQAEQQPTPSLAASVTSTGVTARAVGSTLDVSA